MNQSERIMSFNPNRLYLTHYGEFVNPAGQVESFKRWIDDYVILCQRFGSETDDFEAALQSGLREHVLEGLEATGNSSMENVLQVDLKLNAQGLAYWWKLRSNG